MTRRFSTLDVFTDQPLLGNPLACVVDAAGLDDARMQQLAHWFNLSETSFLLPPTDPAADYRVRIFTPHDELPFAGHPTLGSCAAWLLHGGRPRADGRVIQQCGIGLVTVKVDGARLAFAAPPLKRSGPVEGPEREQALASLGVLPLDLQWVDNGPGWIAARYASAAQVLALRPDFQRMGKLKIGVCGAQAPGTETQFETRGFVPYSGVPEDPVTGSFQAGLARWLIGAGLAPPQYVAAQGTGLGRAGRVHVQQQGDTIWVGGAVLPLVQGSLAL